MTSFGDFEFVNVQHDVDFNPTMLQHELASILKGQFSQQVMIAEENKYSRTGWGF